MGWQQGGKVSPMKSFYQLSVSTERVVAQLYQWFLLVESGHSFCPGCKIHTEPTRPGQPGYYLLEWVDFANNSGEASRKSFHRTDSLSGNCLPLANFVTPGLKEFQHSSERARVDILWHQSGRRGTGVRKVLRTIPPCANNHRIYIFVTQASMRKDNGNWHWPGRRKETLFRSFYGRIVVRSGIM